MAIEKPNWASPDEEECRFDDETPHNVTLTKGFYMLQTEVTRQMWEDLKAEQPTLLDDPSYTGASPTLNHPVQFITWTESVLFCNLLSLNDSYTQCYYKDTEFTVPLDATNYNTGETYCDFDADGYRLPTESEFEYACRAGTTTAFSFEEPAYTEDNCSSCTAGSHPILEQHAVYCANDPAGTEAVGSKIANPWNLYDMHGNVWEWCWDFHDDYPTGDVVDPTGPDTGTDRMTRGGAWQLPAQYARSASRFIIAPPYRMSFQGFRIVRGE